MRKKTALKEKEVVAAKEAAESKVRILEERLLGIGDELEGVWQDVLRKKLRVRELKLAKKKWEEEVVRLWDWYKTPEGFINAVMEKVVVTSFFKDQWCYKLFFQVAAPVAGDTLAVLRDHIQRTNLTFELSEKSRVWW